MNGNFPCPLRAGKPSSVHAIYYTAASNKGGWKTVRKDHKIRHRVHEVNLSIVQCEDEALAQKYIGILQKYDLPPRRINLEITESAAIAEKKVLLDNMHKLIDYGVAFSLDDFGNGQFNLNYIVEMPVEIVKFDHDMTQAYFETEKAKFALEAAVRMIHNMRLKIVSEGVETEEQLKVLTDLGIDYIQGYYFSKPIEAKAFIEFVRERNH